MVALRLRQVPALRHVVRAQQTDTPTGNSVEAGSVKIDNESSPLYTVVIVSGKNHPGLLTAITGMFRDFELDVRKAEVSTHEDEVSDSFSIVDEDGQKIVDEKLLERVRVALQVIIEGSPRAKGRPSFPRTGVDGHRTEITTALMGVTLLYDFFRPPCIP
jgi:UTP:GlnB (protein PII) uridylyltransferase